MTPANTAKQQRGGVERWIRLCSNCGSERIGLSVGGNYDCDDCKAEGVKPEMVRLVPESPLNLSPEDCERLAAMLDVHVRPVYFKAAKKGDMPEFAAAELVRCDRLADMFREAGASK